MISHQRLANQTVVEQYTDMPRGPICHQLPPLTKACGRFAGFDQRENRTVRLTQLLRVVAETHRDPRPQPFYSVREVAGHFGVSLQTVAEAYRRLQQQGFLVRVRGSQTLLIPRQEHLRPVRGVVAVPIWLPGFLAHYDWRLFFICLEEALRRHNFVPDLIFYRQSEEIQPEFVRRVLAHAPDRVVWLAPAPGDRMTLDRLIDHGISVTVIGSSVPMLPGQRYTLNQRTALQECFRDWCDDGINTVVLPQREKPAPSPPAQQMTIAENMHLSTRLIPFDGGSATRFLNTLPGSDHAGVWIHDDMWWEQISSREPQAAARLCRRCRLLVTRPLSIHPSHLRETSVDFIAHDWESLAVRVARDIAVNGRSHSGDVVTLEAQYRPRLAAASIAQHFRAA